MTDSGKPKHRGPRILRKRSAIAGWGVFARQPIPKNTRIVHYDGEKISHKESNRREKRHQKKGHIWSFIVNRRWVRDAAVGGNVARFINHGCKPNCYVHIVGDVIWIRAAKPIAKGEELTYDYQVRKALKKPCQCRPGCTTVL
jgi:SET domain-containing protein